MGLDFIRNAAPGFNRVLDRRLVEMHSPTLFSRDVPIIARTARADMCGDVKVTLGEKVLLRVVNNKVIVQRLNAEIVKAMSVAEMKEKFLSFGTDAVTGTPDDLGRFLAAEVAKIGKIAKDVGAKNE